MNEKMRSIKFRAFFKPKREMVYLRPMGASCAEGSHIIFGCEEYGHQFYDSLNDDEWELMQFTGLTDKNGKEIFEGDIVQYNYGDYKDSMKITVAYHEKSASFSLPTDYDGEVVQLEIIGNIYENPELLKF